jgi:hypothetical protein
MGMELAPSAIGFARLQREFQPTMNLPPPPHRSSSPTAIRLSPTRSGSGTSAPDARRRCRRGPKIYLLSPQLVASSERFARPVPLFGISPAEALAHRKDLVVIVDEAHHVGRLSSRETTAWAGAIRGLSPCLLQASRIASPQFEPSGCGLGGFARLEPDTPLL